MMRVQKTGSQPVGPSLSSPIPHWVEVWRLVVEDSNYQEQLDCCARQCLIRTRCPLKWLEDLKHDAMLLMARQLCRLARLSKDLEERVRSCLGAATRRHCQEALRRMRTIRHRSAVSLDEEAVVERCIDLDALIDLDVAINALPEPERTILALEAHGTSLKEIAAKLGMGYWKVWRLSRRGIEQLRSSFVSDETQPIRAHISQSKSESPLTSKSCWRKDFPPKFIA